VKKKPTPYEPGRRISAFHLDLHPTLFDHLESVSGPLTKDQCRAALVLDTVRIERFVQDVGLPGGRPFYSVKPSARALLVKSLLNVATTKSLLARLEVDHGLRTLCGFSGRLPSESTLSRHFRMLAQAGVLDQVHESLVQEYLGQATVHHLSRDSSAIVGREKSKVRKKVKASLSPKPKRPPSRILEQLEQDYARSLQNLPRVCDVGRKTGSNGFALAWVGFKLHLDVADDGLPLSAFTSSASLHDSQVAVPLSRMTKARVGGVFYELMDKAYDANGIREAVCRQGHVPLIEAADRGVQKAIPFDPAQARRFKCRTAIERTFSDLKDNHGGRTVRVKGPDKVHTHLMFGVLTVFALILLGLR